MTFDLGDNVYKENNKPVYIDKHSNHPPSILKQLPISIEKRISKTSNKDIFDESIKQQYALKESGFSETLNYIAPTTNKKQISTKQKIVWFNPSFSRSVKTNVGRTFLHLNLRNIFSRNHTIQKI